MTVHSFVHALAKALSSWIAFAEVKHTTYAGGGAIHILGKNKRRFKVLIEEE